MKGLISTAALPYVDVLAGLVQTETLKKQASKDSLVEKSFPIYCPTKELCEPNKILPLIPDKKKKSLIYFENNGGVTFNDKSFGYYNYTAAIRMVVWLNPKQLGSADCSISLPISQKLISILTPKIFNSSPLTKIKIRLSKITTKDVAIFSKYKYNRQNDLLEFPYDYFAVDFFVDFSVHQNCVDDFTVDLPDQC